ncbi:hypothetical protein GUJ93_ZPchr0005g15166 [Zizania palustris]|uniref:No apical meristem-associated C-terminal domain-containing protein n=1 Tax=Zizania palustris TaxID=103762 RepID=A0A8J5TA22_ZIZPA|nr:hypothetical protein GUJ93_ZPchr0005g15166 [Zizania palustris]
MLSKNTELDDVSVFSIDTQPIMSQSSGSEPSAVKKSIHAANYSQQEDIQLFDSWEIITMDPITANEQPNCQMFQGFFEQVECCHPSGIPHQEHLLEAQVIYADKDAKKKGFAFIHCWLKVRHSPKFVALQPSKKSITSNSVPIDIHDGEDDGISKSQTHDSSMPSAKRPMRRKQAKDNMRMGGEESKYEGVLEKLLMEKEKIREERWQETKKIQEHKTSIEERKVTNEDKRLMWKQEQKIIFYDLNTLDPM